MAGPQIINYFDDGALRQHQSRQNDEGMGGISAVTFLSFLDLSNLSGVPFRCDTNVLLSSEQYNMIKSIPTAIPTP